MENDNRNKMDWLKILANDESLWEKRAYAEMPAVIAHEYKRLHDLAEEGNVYGVMLQIKDVYEIVLKYPCVLGLCIFEHTNVPAGVESFDALMAEILNKLLSLGDWRDKIIKALKKFKDYLPAQLIAILEITYQLSHDQFVGRGADGGKGIDVVNWRNDVIGHGALRLVEDEALKREIRSMLEKLKQYFGAGSKNSIYGYYDDIVLKQGNRALVGWQAADLEGETAPFSLEIKNNAAFPHLLENVRYILPDEDKICFFDTYMKYKKKSKYLDYVAGHLNIQLRDFFYELYVKLERTGKIKTMQEFSGDVTDTETEKLLAGLEQPAHFQKPNFIYRWMETKLHENSKGCYMLRMGRGMGKSAFSAYLDGRDSNAKESPIHGDFIIRTYHCSRNQIRGINDFVTSLNFMFLEDDHRVGGTIGIEEGVFETIQRGNKADKAKTAKLLNSCASYYRKKNGKEIVLVVDGLDEIVDYDIFEYFPDVSSLDDGVHIFYTARPDKELSKELRKQIGGIDVQETRNITNDDEEYKEVVLEYAKKEVKNEMQNRAERAKDTEAYKILADEAGFNFLKLRVLIPVYCNGNDMGEDALKNETDMFARYLSMLENQYGDKFFRRCVKPLLVNLAVFYDGLTLNELLSLMDNMNSSLMLYATLNDLRGILSVERSAKGNVYKLANEEYIRYIKERQHTEIQKSKQRYRETISEVYTYLTDMPDEIFDEGEAELRKAVLQAFPQFDVIRPRLLNLDVDIDINNDFLEMLLDIDDWIGFDQTLDRDLEYLDVYKWIIEKVQTLSPKKDGWAAAPFWYMLIKNRSYCRLKLIFDFTQECHNYFKHLISEGRIDNFVDSFWLAYDLSSVTTRNKSILEEEPKYKWVYLDLVRQALRKKEYEKVLNAIMEGDRDIASKRDATVKVLMQYEMVYQEHYKYSSTSPKFRLIRITIDKKMKQRMNEDRYQLYNLLLNLCILSFGSFARIHSLNETITSLGCKPKYLYMDDAEENLNEQDAKQLFEMAIEAINGNDRDAYLRAVASMAEKEDISRTIWEEPAYRAVVYSNSEIMFDDVMWEMVNRKHPIYQRYDQDYTKAANILDSWLRNNRREEDSSPKNLLNASMLVYFQFRYPIIRRILPSASCEELVNFVRHIIVEPMEPSWRWILLNCLIVVLSGIFKTMHVFPKKVDVFVEKVFEFILHTGFFSISAIQNVISKRKCMLYDFKHRKLKTNKLYHLLQGYYDSSKDKRDENDKNFFSHFSFGILVRFMEWCRQIQFYDGYDEFISDFLIKTPDLRIGRELFLAYLEQPTIEQVSHFKKWINRYKKFIKSMDNDVLQFYFNQFHSYFVYMVKLHQNKDLFDALSNEDKDILNMLHDSAPKINMQRYVIYITWMAWFCYDHSKAEDAEDFARIGMSFIQDKVFSKSNDYDYSIFLDGWIVCSQILWKLGKLSSLDLVYEPFGAILAHIKNREVTSWYYYYMLMMLFNLSLAASLLKDYSKVFEIIPEIQNTSDEADKRWNTSRFSDVSKSNIDVMNLIACYKTRKISLDRFLAETKEIVLRFPVFPQFTTQVLGICHEFMKLSEYREIFRAKLDWRRYYVKRYPCFFLYSDIIYFPFLIQTFENRPFEFVTDFRTQFLSPSDFLV